MKNRKKYLIPTLAVLIFGVWWWTHADAYARADLLAAMAAFAAMAMTAAVLFCVLWLFRLLP